jgi:hypothetical protein
MDIDLVSAKLYEYQSNVLKKSSNSLKELGYPMVQPLRATYTQLGRLIVNTSDQSLALSRLDHTIDSQQPMLV